jgi:signal transduction histidine kinase
MRAMSTVPAPWLSVVAAEAIVMAVLSLMFAAIWRRTREPGMPALALGFVLAAAWYAYSEHIAYTGPHIDTVAQRAAAAAIGLMVVLISVGAIQYLGMPRGRLRPLVFACWASALTMVAAVAFTPLVPHRVFHVCVLVAYLGAAAVAFRRAAQQRGDAHWLLGVALLSLPVTPFAMAAFGVPARELKYFAGVSVIACGLVLLTVSLLRRQRRLAVEVARRAAAEEQLRDGNARLEARVQERTAHLHELIEGLEAFNRSVSHDLRGPLSGMSSLARMAADSLGRGDSSLAQRALPLIAGQCDASVGMVNTMLELARLGDAPVERQPVCMADLARSAFDEIRLAHPDHAPPALFIGQMPLVMADSRLLRAVFVNLLGNAVKFTRDAPHPRIDVEATVDGTNVSVCVRDNGVGFSADVAERLFDPFYRAHDKRFEGHGLGLSIVRRAVQALGGSTWARPLVPGGALLCFKLPDAVVVDAPSATALHGEPAAVA